MRRASTAPRIILALVQQRLLLGGLLSSCKKNFRGFAFVRNMQCRSTYFAYSDPDTTFRPILLTEALRIAQERGTTDPACDRASGTKAQRGGGFRSAGGNKPRNENENAGGPSSKRRRNF